MEILLGLFLVVAVATFGGVIAKLLKLPNLVGFTLAGVLFGLILPRNLKDISSLSEIGTILLLFSIGLELSFDNLSKYLKVAVIGSLVQMFLTGIAYFVILKLFGFAPLSSLIYALGFSLSSTAVVVKMLSDRGELDTIHGNIMMGWLFIQDLAVIPIMIILPILNSGETNVLPLIFLALIKAIIVIVLIIAIGKIVIPFVIHKISEINSRELLLLSSLTIAFGVSYVASFFGISPALGAFLAGVVISEGQENHAIFSETRPLRDLFMAIFFVTMGLMVDTSLLLTIIKYAVIISLFVVIIKMIVVTLLTSLLNYKGKISVLTGFGLANISEFVFVIFTSAVTFKIINSAEATFGIFVTLLTLIFTPVLYKFAIPAWRKIKFIKFFSGSEGKLYSEDNLVNHVVICGYGRVGRWIGKAFREFNIPFVVVEYDRSIVSDLKKSGINVFYGDPSEPEVMDMVNIRGAKLLILAIPDRIVQESLIGYVQSHAPSVKIISRVHGDEDWTKLKSFRIHKMVQPEFEASMSIIRFVLGSSGRSKDEITNIVKRMRLSHN